MALGTVLWKAVDGREFYIDTDKLGIKNVEQLYEHIAKLREEHGYEQPGFGDGNNIVTHALAMNSAMEAELEQHPGTIKTQDLPEDLRKETAEAVLEALQAPDPKKMN